MENLLVEFLKLSILNFGKNAFLIVPRGTIIHYYYSHLIPEALHR